MTPTNKEPHIFISIYIFPKLAIFWLHFLDAEFVTSEVIGLIISWQNPKSKTNKNYASIKTQKLKIKIR